MQYTTRKERTGIPTVLRRLEPNCKICCRSLALDISEDGACTFFENYLGVIKKEGLYDFYIYLRSNSILIGQYLSGYKMNGGGGEGGRLTRRIWYFRGLCENYCSTKSNIALFHTMYLANVYFFAA
jgi:hypothetical protein